MTNWRPSRSNVSIIINGLHLRLLLDFTASQLTLVDNSYWRRCFLIICLKICSKLGTLNWFCIYRVERRRSHLRSIISRSVLFRLTAKKNSCFFYEPAPQRALCKTRSVISLRSAPEPIITTNRSIKTTKTRKYRLKHRTI